MKAASLALCALAFASACVDPANTPQSIFESVWTDFDRNYAFFEVKHIDWNAVHQRYAPRAAAARTLDEIAPVIGAMFGELRDPHVDLVVSPAATYRSVDFTAIHTYFDAGNTLRTYVPITQIAPSRNMRYGLAAPDVGYVWIASFGGTGWSNEIDDALRSFGNAAAVVIDLRNNGGGNSNTAEDMAARFVDQTRVFAHIRFRSGPAHSDFSDYTAKSIGPASTRFTGRVVVLTNRLSVSATEDFVLAMRSQPGIRVVGDTTAGGLGNPLLRELPGGWVYRLPQWMEYGAAKEGYEGTRPAAATGPTVRASTSLPSAGVWPRATR